VWQREQAILTTGLDDVWIPAAWGCVQCGRKTSAEQARQDRKDRVVEYVKRGGIA
jgi:hypothetical protein